MTEQQPLTNTPMPVRLTVDDYLLLDDAGAFEGYGKTELLEGEITYMNAQHRPHSRAKSRLYLAIAQALKDRSLEALVEVSVAIPPHNVPEPDIVVTNEPSGDGLAPLASIRLLIEVSDTTLKHDLGRKADLYAANGIPEYWVIDLTERRVLMHANPRWDGSGYDSQLDVPFGEPLHAVTIEGLTVQTATLG